MTNNRDDIFGNRAKYCKSQKRGNRRLYREVEERRARKKIVYGNLIIYAIRKIWYKENVIWWKLESKEYKIKIQSSGDPKDSQLWRPPYFRGFETSRDLCKAIRYFCNPTSVYVVLIISFIRVHNTFYAIIRSVSIQEFISFFFITIFNILIYWYTIFL